MSLREITLILLFQSVYKSYRAANCSYCFSVRRGKYFNINSILFLSCWFDVSCIFLFLHKAVKEQWFPLHRERYHICCIRTMLRFSPTGNCRAHTYWLNSEFIHFAGLPRIEYCCYPVWLPFLLSVFPATFYSLEFPNQP